MIYTTGDTHGNIDIKDISETTLKKQNIQLTENDYLVILGDFGLPFLNKDIDDYNNKKGSYRHWINWLKNKPYTVLWIDGNHDNFDYWENQPVSEKFGGKVQIHPHAENVIHLMRGEIYRIENKSIFTFDGAESTDKIFRTPHISWWEQEAATDDEIANAIKNLTRYGYKVDYVFTHTPPRAVCAAAGYSDTYDKTAAFLNEMMFRIKYKAWFAGHLHKEFRLIMSKMCVQYHSVENTETIEESFA